MDLLSPPVSTPVYQGEKVVSNPLYRDGRFIFTTLIPKSDPCEYGGTSWLMELDALTGRRIDVPPVDINNDGVIDASDMITVAGVPIVPSGVESSVGITPEPGILTDPNKAGMEYKYFAGTSGDIQKTGESRDPMSIGRQSWKESR
jgi:type IV pilus assembly protein PilY1